MPDAPTPPDLARLRIRRDTPSTAAPRRRVWPFVLLAVAVVAVAAVALRPRTTEVAVGSVSVSAAGGGGGSISANGYVVARTKASVSAKIAGRLVSLGVREGSQVRSGQIIARIESSIYVAALNAAKADAQRADVERVQARRDFDRATTLAAQDVLSRAELDATQTRADAAAAAVATARAQVELARANLENTNVRAPFDGTVLRKDAEVGEIVAPSAAGGGLTRTAIVTMADLRTLEVEVDVNEAYIAQIRNGQDAGVTLGAYPDTSFRARVRQIVPTADRQKATVQVKVSILDRDPRILPEMGAKVVFLREAPKDAAAARPQVLVPSAAVARDGASTRVWIVQDAKLVRRDVVLGRERGDQFEVREGLDGAESVVLNPPATLKDGQRVRVRATAG